MINLQSLSTRGHVFDLIEYPEFTVQGELKPSGELFIHCTGFSSWSPSTYKKALTAIAILKDIAKARDFDKIWVMIPYSDKLFKFETMMGFEPEYTYMDAHNAYWVLMSQGTD